MKRLLKGFFFDSVKCLGMWEDVTFGGRVKVLHVFLGGLQYTSHLNFEEILGYQTFKGHI